VTSTDERVSVSDQVLRELRHQILTGELSPGDTLPGERALSKRFGVNRGAVRESLKRLEQSGLIKIQHGESTRILDFRHAGTLDVMTELVDMPGGKVDLEALRGLLLLSISACTAAARLAAGAHPEAGEVLHVEIAKLESAQGVVRAIVAARIAYWDVLFEACGDLGHRMLWNSIQKAALPFARFVEEHYVDSTTEVDYLERIAKTVTEGDPEAAERAVREASQYGVVPLLSRIKARRERGERFVILEPLTG